MTEYTGNPVLDGVIERAEHLGRDAGMLAVLVRSRALPALPTEVIRAIGETSRMANETADGLLLVSNVPAKLKRKRHNGLTDLADRLGDVAQIVRTTADIAEDSFEGDCPAREAFAVELIRIAGDIRRLRSLAETLATYLPDPDAEPSAHDVAVVDAMLLGQPAPEPEGIPVQTAEADHALDMEMATEAEAEQHAAWLRQNAELDRLEAEDRAAADPLGGRNFAASIAYAREVTEQRFAAAEPVAA